MSLHRSTPRLFAVLSLGILLAALSTGGCSAPPPPLAATHIAELTPSPALPASPPATTASPSAVPASSPQVLAACDIDLQAQAMRAGHLPDWNALGLDTCYELTLELKPDDPSYTGAARVTFTNLTGDNLTDVVFRIYPNSRVIYGGALDITSAQTDGRDAAPEVFLPDKTAARLPFETPLPGGATTVIDFQFEGRLPVDFASSDVYGIFNYSTEGPIATMANWYPILAVWDVERGAWSAERVLGEGDAVVSETALYRVHVTAPAGWQVVTTGSLLESSREGDSTTHDFVSGPARDFMIVTGPALESREAEANGVRVAHWGLSDDESSRDAALEAASGSIGVYDARIGAYPFADLDAVAVPLQNAAGVEYPGVILIADSLYTSEPDLVLQVTVAHEVAHQWWYSVVGNDVLAWPWQDEGLTSFTSALYFEGDSPAFYRRLIDFYELSFDDYKQREGDEPIAQPLSAFRGRSDAYGAIVYAKGALFFAELREHIGDDAFFEALKTYYDENRYQLVEPDVLLAAFEASCGCELDTWYSEWGVVAP